MAEHYSSCWVELELLSSCVVVDVVIATVL